MTQINKPISTVTLRRVLARMARLTNAALREGDTDSVQKSVTTISALSKTIREIEAYNTKAAVDFQPMNEPGFDTGYSDQDIASRLAGYVPSQSEEDAITAKLCLYLTRKGFVVSPQSPPSEPTRLEHDG